MKNILFVIALGTLLIGSSCNKSFISLAPGDQVSGATFFRTEDQFRQALTAAYVPLRSLMNNDFITAEMRSDNTDFEYNDINFGTAIVFEEQIPEFMDDPTNTYSINEYYDCYLGISRANIVIGRIANVTMADSAKADILGQAEFLRAFYYFRLVRYYGAVPLFLNEVTNADQAFLVRSSADSVYNQIITDAKDAIAKLKAPAAFPQSGEATKGSATMLLADVYMTRKDYADAASLLATLPAMGYALLPSYADVFSTAHKNSRESLFEVQYQQGIQGGQQSNFIYMFLPRSTNTSIVTGVATNNSSIGGWNTPTQDLIDSYEPGDKRLDASIGIAEGTYNASAIFTITAYKSILNYTPAPGTEGVPFIKKYLNPSTIPNNTDDDWPIYRYADALLLRAEALNELNHPDQALPFLNQVRERAGLKDITTTDQSALRDIIAHERRVELAFENFRWFDLIRTGKAIQVMTAFGNKMKQMHSYLPATSYNVTQDRLLYPIPQFEIELNPALTQNPGY